MEGEVDKTRKEGSIISPLQNIGEQQRLQNRMEIKALIRCIHFLTHQHITYTTKFDKLIVLVVICGGATLQTFLEIAGGNANYTSKIFVVKFVNVLGTWVEEFLLKRLHKTLVFSIMADECTDVTTIEELIICFSWVESRVPEEHFFEILPLKKLMLKYLFYIRGVLYCRETNIKLGRLIGMGFDGAATFLGDKTGVQRW